MRELLGHSANDGQANFAAESGPTVEHETDDLTPIAMDKASQQSHNSSNEESPEIEYSSNGTTHCDRATGTMSTSITNTKCTKQCTEAHEADHREYRKDCCKVYSAARKDAVDKGDWRTRNTLTKRYNKWVRDTSDFSECRAFGKSVDCGKKIRKEFSCTAPKKENKQCCKDIKSYLRSMRKHRRKRCPGTDKACPAFS